MLRHGASVEFNQGVLFELSVSRQYGSEHEPDKGNLAVFVVRPSSGTCSEGTVVKRFVVFNKSFDAGVARNVVSGLFEQ